MTAILWVLAPWLAFAVIAGLSAFARELSRIGDDQ